jgi:uncharacterized protein YkwD
MSKLHHAKSLAATFIAAWALVACGGSNSTNDGSNTGNAGGSSGTNTPSTGFSGQDASAPKLINNIATDGLNWINYRRSQVGMSTLTRNGRIDIAAQGHSDYQRINNIVSHDEVPGKQGYTGTILQDRLAAASYVIQPSNAIGEVISETTHASGLYMSD